MVRSLQYTSIRGGMSRTVCVTQRLLARLDVIELADNALDQVLDLNAAQLSVK